MAGSGKLSAQQPAPRLCSGKKDDASHHGTSCVGADEVSKNQASNHSGCDLTYRAQALGLDTACGAGRLFV